jgi:hypothetical protein
MVHKTSHSVWINYFWLALKPFLHCYFTWLMLFRIQFHQCRFLCFVLRWYVCPLISTHVKIMVAITHSLNISSFPLHVSKSAVNFLYIHYHHHTLLSSCLNSSSFNQTWPQNLKHTLLFFFGPLYEGESINKVNLHFSQTYVSIMYLWTQ